MGGGEAGCTSSNLWLAQDPSKRWGEIFFLLCTPFWLTLCLRIVVPYKLYESFTEWEYLIVGLISALPAFIIPIIFCWKGNIADSSKCWKDRYWIKVSIGFALLFFSLPFLFTLLICGSCFSVTWGITSGLIIFSVLGASYTFPSWKMNNDSALYGPLAGEPAVGFQSQLDFRPFILHSISRDCSYFQSSMYKYGSLFYAIYFVISFPMFFRIDEKPGDWWDLPRVAIDALGAAMLVTIILDLWRVFLGPIIQIADSKQCLQPRLPWFPGNA
ncbi:cyclopropyl isomerase [Striga asiatica]|uniref:Cyclopropyl isomerase n=1 Tax=Striga asiatica TaxID=4170 RepID=A0A5A7QL63_STRAF|nr:cyclopropyl isomerase [Striga asiatica]